MNKRGFIFILPLLIQVIIVVGFLLLCIFPFFGIYRLLVSPIIQWGLVIAFTIWLFTATPAKKLLRLVKIR